MPLCERCHKEQATVHLTEIRNEKKLELHLCQGCAEAEGVVVKQTLDISNLLAGIASGSAAKRRARAAGPRKVCPRCGYALDDFQSTGRLGCPQDYTVFHDELEPLLKKIHGAAAHVGKVPPRAAAAVRRETELQRLEADLRRAVAREDFESAARLRDELKKLREQPDAAR